MKKKLLLFLAFAGPVFLAGLQSCTVSNNNPVVPALIPTSTPTSSFTPSPTSTNTPTAVPTGTPLTTCATPVTFAATPIATTTLAAGLMYSDQVTLAAPSNINRILVNTNGASSTSGVLQVGLYSDNGYNFPGRLIFNSNTQSFTTTGNMTYIFPVTPFSLPAGKYWITSYSSILYYPFIGQSAGLTSYTASGQFPTSFPTNGVNASSIPPWSYELDTCK